MTDIITTLRRMCEEWGFLDTERAIVAVLENTKKKITPSIRRSWELDVLLHELAHYQAARGFLVKADGRTLQGGFWTFPGHANEIAVCVVAHLAAKNLRQEFKLFPHRTIKLDESIAYSGLDESYKMTGAPTKIARLMLKDPQLVLYARELARVTELHHVSYNQEEPRTPQVGSHAREELQKATDG